MRIIIQRPYFSIHSNYRDVGTMRVYPCGDSHVSVEIWADHDSENGIDRAMENGMMADLTVEQAKQLRDMIDKAIGELDE